jgi:hypothetical protein
MGELRGWNPGQENALPGLRMSLLDAARGAIEGLAKSDVDREDHVCVVREMFKMAGPMLRPRTKTALCASILSTSASRTGMAL